jgi:hypothetical protein
VVGVATTSYRNSLAFLSHSAIHNSR